MEIIDATARSLRQLAEHSTSLDVDPPESFNHIKFSFSQQQQLRDLLRRWRAISHNAELPVPTPDTIVSARDALKHIEQLNKEQTVSYST